MTFWMLLAYVAGVATPFIILVAGAALAGWLWDREEELLG